MKHKFCKILSVSIFSIIMAFATVFGVATFARSDKNETIVAASNWEYGISQDYYEELLSVSDLPSEYSLSDIFPLVSENQDDTSYCWLFASLKSLESSLLVQTGEYYNFSEVGLALLGKENGVISSFSVEYNFLTFCNISKNYGIVYESDFSNDYYVSVTDSNYSSYLSLLQGNIDQGFMQNITPVIISSTSTNISTAFSNLSNEDKKEFLKAYITIYGGFFAGVERGIIYSTNNTYGRLESDETVDSPYDGYISGNHAICIIGWNESGFIALNSWGVETGMFSEFIIPYTYCESYAFFYGNLYGFDCNYSSQENLLIGSSATEYSELGFSPIKNIFNYNEEISLTYQLSEPPIDTAVNIYSRGEDVTAKFDITVTENGFLVSASGETLSELGGAYKITFQIGDSIFYTSEFYVFTGLELAYVKLEPNAVGTSVTKSVRLASTFSSGNDSATYIVSNSNGNSYYLLFYLPTYSLNTGKTLWLSGANVTTKNSEGVITATDVTSEFNVSVTNSEINKNLITATITNLAVDANENKMFEFIFTYKASSGVQTDFSIKFYISEIKSINSSNINSVVYNLDGGVNNASNVNFLPDYSVDDAMTGVLVFAPTKMGAEFVGWFIDENFEEELSYYLEENSGLKQYYISSDVTGTLCLYARWQSDEILYFEGAIGVIYVTDYFDIEKDINLDDGKVLLTYGDKLYLNFSVTQVEESINNFTIKITAFLGENVLINPTYFKNQFENLEFSVSELDLLKVGEQRLTVEMYMVINNQIIKTSVEELIVEVSPKEISISESIGEEFVFTYNGEPHAPAINFVGVLGDDLIYPRVKSDNSVGYTVGFISQINAGQYTYYIIGLSNDNYILNSSYNSNDTYFTMIIEKAEISVIFSELMTTYNGFLQSPSCVVNGEQLAKATDVLFVSLSFDGDSSVGGMKNAGTYQVSAYSLTGSSSENYQLCSNEAVEFTILPVSITISFNDITERLRVDPVNRSKNFSYNISGAFVGGETIEDLNMELFSEGVNATEIGVYAITATINNSNYDVTIVAGKYMLTGYYSVYYYLDGELLYIEEVDEGENPVGLTKEVYKTPFLSKISYSEELAFTGEDLYIDVTVTSYAWTLFIGIAIFGFVAIYIISLIFSRKKHL